MGIGISGILRRVIHPTRNEIGWRLAFVAGPLLAPLLDRALGGVFATLVIVVGLYIVTRGLLALTGGA